MEIAEWMDLLVAAGTLALAAATFWMARATRDMAAVAQQQFDRSVTPILRAARLGQPGEADASVVHTSDGEVIEVVIENMGPAAAEVERCHLIPFGEGKVVDPDKLFSPVLLPGDTREFAFPISSRGRTTLESEERATLRIIYMAVATGARFKTVIYFRCDEKVGCWTLLGEQAPRPLATR